MFEAPLSFCPPPLSGTDPEPGPPTPPAHHAGNKYPGSGEKGAVSYQIDAPYTRRIGDVTKRIILKYRPLSEKMHSPLSKSA